MNRRMLLVILATLAGIILPNLFYAKEPESFKLGFMSSFTGEAAVAETQKNGVLLKIYQINKDEGLKMPWGKVKIEIDVKDDKLDVDLGVKLFREMVQSGIHGMIGLVSNSLASAINNECKTSGLPFLPSCIPAFDSLKKGNPAEGTFGVAFTPWSIGYLTGGSVIKTLNKKKIYFVQRSDSWGTSMLEGIKKASETFGGEVIGVSETPRGTADFSAIINKAKETKPEIFVTSMFGADAVNNLKQAYDLGLYDITTIFNTWITNSVAMNVPDAALGNMYALTYFYYNLKNFEDQELAKQVNQFTEQYLKMWNTPPDAYAAFAYTAADILFQAVEKAGSFDSKKINPVLAASRFSTVKGEVYFRQDHQMVSKYMSFLVRGKKDKEKKDKYDVFEVVGSFGGEESLPSLKSLGY